jgi:hypothetical protein
MVQVQGTLLKDPEPKEAKRKRTERKLTKERSSQIVLLLTFYIIVDHLMLNTFTSTSQ